MTNFNSLRNSDASQNRTGDGHVNPFKPTEKGESHGLIDRIAVASFNHVKWVAELLKKGLSLISGATREKISKATKIEGAQGAQNDTIQ